MACGGLSYIEDNLPSTMRVKNPTLRILDFAKDMMTAISTFEGLKLKIGVHYGRCMMGVIGWHKPQFSLIGDTVNTTSRHCTTGEPGHIMVSREAWKNLSESSAKTNGYTVRIKKAFMKGKGDVDVYHVFPGKKKFFSRFKNALKNANQNHLNSMKGNNQMASEFKILKGVFNDERKSFAPDFNKLGELIDKVKNNMKVLQQLQEEREKIDNNKKGGKGGTVAKKKAELDNDDDISDEFEISSTDDEEVSNSID